MLIDDAPLGGVTYARFFPSDWRSGCLSLTLEEEGLYIRSCAWMYHTGQMLPGNDRVAARLLNVQVQKYEKVMGSLVAKGKMIRAQGYILNKRVLDEIDTYRQQQAKRSEAAHRREEDRRRRLEKAATDVILNARHDPRGAENNTITPPRPPHLPPHQPGGGWWGGTPHQPPRVSPGVIPKKSTKSTIDKQNRGRTRAQLWQTLVKPESRIHIEKRRIPPLPPSCSISAMRWRSSGPSAASAWRRRPPSVRRSTPRSPRPSTSTTAPPSTGASPSATC